MVSGKPKYRSPRALTPNMLDKINRYWRAANYLCIGQIYLFENPCARALEGGTDQAKAARTLGNVAGTEPHLHSSEPPYQRA